MDKFKALEPVRLHQQTPTPSSKPSRLPPRPTGPLVGRLPQHVHLLILEYVAVPDLPAYARTCRVLSRLAMSEEIWIGRYKGLGIEESELGQVLEGLETRIQGEKEKDRAHAPPTLNVVDDEFGDFATANSAISDGVDLFAPAEPDELGDFIGGTSASFVPSRHSMSMSTPTVKTARSQYMRVHGLLKPLTRTLLEPPHQILTNLFAVSGVTELGEQAKILCLLFLFLLGGVPPLRNDVALVAGLRAAADRFDAALLTAFESADSRSDEPEMRRAADASWEVWTASKRGRTPNVGTYSIGTDTGWEMGRVWAEKREIFYTTGEHKPRDNFTPSGSLDFNAMDAFMTYVLCSLREHGARAVRVFPPASRVLLAFADRIANEVVGEYITPLLTHARSLQNGTLFLRATAACFREAWRLVDAIIQIADSAGTHGHDLIVTKTQAEDVVFRMFEPNMDEYLDEEVETLKHAVEAICKQWEKQAAETIPPPITDNAQTTLLNSSSYKRSVLSSFTDILLLPVTIVPRTVVATANTVSGAAVQGISMLDPRRWGADTAVVPTNDYRQQIDANPVIWDGEGDDELDEKPVVPASAAPTAIESKNQTYDNLQLLLSLDITLELIHASRESLKRVETFEGYPGTYGVRVRETIEEVAIEMLQTLGSRHVKVGFESAITQMHTYQPPAHPGETAQGEQEKLASTSVAPLVQFFELVHIGDMIQSIVQVYFDKELAPHIDASDFLNAVVREKKRFENLLDDSVAQGLNAGIEVLMNQVDHIILTLTPPRAYYPPEDAPLLLGPSIGCTEAVKCLEDHIRLLKGNVNREVLEVFETEVGVRLINILQKHIKRQIISLNGGFQVIADLNTYHAFIASLKIPSLTSDFANLKMLGHVFIVEDAKDLAQIVRDVTRYGGAYRPEDIYEFVQRRSDWKKIEKVVDKTMYNLNLREDCLIA